MHPSSKRQLPYVFIFFCTLLIIICLGFFLWSHSEIVEEKETLSVFSIEKTATEQVVRHQEHEYTFRLDLNYEIYNMQNIISFYDSIDISSSTAYAPISYTIGNEYQSLEEYFDRVINVLEDPILSLEKQDPLFVNEVSISVAKVDATKSYYPTEGGVTYLYLVPIDSGFTVLSVSLINHDSFPPEDDIIHLITQIIN